MPVCKPPRSTYGSPSGPPSPVRSLPDALSEELVHDLRYGVGLVALRLCRFQALAELRHAGAEPLALGACSGEPYQERARELLPLLGTWLLSFYPQSPSLRDDLPFTTNGSRYLPEHTCCPTTLSKRAAETTDLQGVCTQDSTKNALGTKCMLARHAPRARYPACRWLKRRGRPGTSAPGYSGIIVDRRI